MSNNNKNIKAVEMMRGIAAMMVAYFHIFRGNPRYLPDSNAFVKLGAYGWAGVEMFFVISGFIITYAMFHGGYRLARVHRFVAKRFVRLEPPYIVSIAVVLVLMYVSTLSPHYRGADLDIDWGNVLGHLGYVNAFTGEKWLQDVYWTLAVEFEFYLGLALIYPLLVHRKKWASLFAAAALLAMTFVPVAKEHVFQYLPFFVMGISYSLLRCGVYSNIEFGFFFAVAVILGLYIHGPILVGLGLITVAAIAFIHNVPRWLTWLGHISYSLYLLHIPIGGRIVNITEVLTKSVNLRLIVAFVALAVCIFCAYLFNRLVERPSQKLSKKISY